MPKSKPKPVQTSKTKNTTARDQAVNVMLKSGFKRHYTSKPSPSDWALGWEKEAKEFEDKTGFSVQELIDMQVIEAKAEGVKECLKQTNIILDGMGMNERENNLEIEEVYYRAGFNKAVELMKENINTELESQ